MSEFPAMLRIAGRRAVVVGGGTVALRRAKALAEAGARITVIAPLIGSELEAVADHVERRVYHEGDLEGAFLVIAATDDEGVNERVGQEARRVGALLNRTDRPEAGDFVVPAHSHLGPISITVHTGGISARAAAVMRDQIIGSLDRDWVRLLETVAPYRRRIQEELTDPAERHAALHRLTDPQAMDILKKQGPDGLRRHCENLLLEAELPASDGEAG